MKGKLLFCFFLCFFTGTFAQKRVLDSLKLLLKANHVDTTRINILNKLAWEYKTSNPDTALILSEQALELSLKNEFLLGLNKSYRQIGWFSYLKGNYPKAFDNFDRSLAVCDQMQNSGNFGPDVVDLQRARTYNNIGSVYFTRGDYPRCLDYYLKAYKIFDQLKIKLDIGKILGNIALVYGAQKNYELSGEFQLKALKIKEEMGDKVAINNSLGNLGVNYFRQNSFAKALECDLKAIKVAEEIGDKNAIAVNYGNIANIYVSLKDFAKAHDYYTKAITLTAELGSKREMAIWYNGLGGLYVIEKNYELGIEYINKSIVINKELGSLDGLRENHEHLSLAFEKKGDFNKALEFYKLFISNRDSITNEENTKQLVRSEMNFEFDKKEAASKLEQEKKEEVAFAESKKQKIIIYSVFGILLLVMIFAVFAYRSFLEKQKSNKEITKQKNIIEEKQKEILDSIHYAKRIQTALMANETYIDKKLRQINP